MPQIDHPEFLERMMTLLGAHPVEGPVETAGLIPPMAELNAAPHPFAEVYGAEGLFAQTAIRAMEDGEQSMAALLSALQVALENGRLDLAPPDKPAPRLGGFVYPVV
ncbi:hypothetical protein [Roseovarius mucosus]|uniref:hypothetical protein n=1 Tax=Roseovarius mucosus TaxID=215743 RepID=UPI003BAA627D